MKFCENCGAQLEADAKFCEGCGTKVAEVSDIATDAAFVLEQDDDTPVELGENPEPAPETNRRGRIKKEKPVREKKEKPVREKKEKPVREKKERPARVKKVKPVKGQAEEGAEGADSTVNAGNADSADGGSDASGAETKGTGIKKLIPLIIGVVIIVLLIPGNVLFVLDFLSADKKDDAEPPPQIVVPTPDVIDEPDEELPDDEDDPDTDDASDEDDPDEDDISNGDANGGSDDDNQPQTETNIARLMGRTTERITEVFGQPDSEITENGITVWSYGTRTNVSLIIEIFNNRAFQITLLSDEYSIFGIEHGENIIDARTHLIVNLGFIFTGDVVVDDVTHLTFMNLYNSITVMVALVASEDGTVAELIFTDMDVAQIIP